MILASVIVRIHFLFTQKVRQSPKASNLLAGQIYPIPSAQEIEGQKIAIEQQISNEAQRKIRKMQKEVIRKLDGDDAIRSALIKLVADVNQESLDKINKERDKIQVAYERKLRRQLDIAMNLSRISPASCYTFAITSLANTGITCQQQFLRKAKQYQREFANYVIRKIREGKGLSFDSDDPNDKVDLSDMPQFRTEYPTLDASFSESWVDILLLFVMGIVFFMAAYASFLRRDVH